jgi:hypothetical protein
MRDTDGQMFVLAGYTGTWADYAPVKNKGEHPCGRNVFFDKKYYLCS